MRHGRDVRFCTAIATIAALLCGAPGPAAAQAPRDGAGASVPAPPPSDFMLGQPRVFATFDSGFLFANTGSDLYDFITDQLTLERSSFNTPMLGGRLGVSLTPHVDVMIGIDTARSTTESEYRDFVDNQLLPINQTTKRSEFGVFGSVRVSLLPTGRRISRFAWIPRTFTPYVGVGAGAVKYEFQQYGSFVDFATSRVFNDTFRSEGWAPSAHVFAGSDVRVYRRLYLSVEGRYTYAKATLGADFVDFDPIDLAGFRMGGGLRVVF